MASGTTEVCTVCGDDNFEQIDGFFYCSTCQTQSQNIRVEESQDFMVGLTAGLRLRRIETASPADKRKQAPTGRPWELVEAHTIILRKQVDALILHYGANPKLKDVVFKLWSVYLSLTGNAFNNAKEDAVLLNKLASMNARIREKKPPIHTEESQKPKKRKRKEKQLIKAQLQKKQLEQTLGNEDFYEGDNPLDADQSSSSDENEDICRSEYGQHMDTVYKQINRLNLKNLLSFLHLGLLYCHNVVTVADIHQLVEKGTIPFNNTQNLLPEDMKFNSSDTTIFTNVVLPSPTLIRTTTARLMVYMNLGTLPLIDLRPLCHRYLVQLILPGELHGIITRMVEKSGPMLNVSRHRHNCKFMLLSPEVIAMAHIVILLKMLFVLNDDLEMKISEYARRVNMLSPDLQLFVWDEWVFHHISSKERLPNHVSDVLKVHDVKKSLSQVNNTVHNRRYSSTTSLKYFEQSEYRRLLEKPIDMLANTLKSKTSLAADSSHNAYSQQRDSYTPDLQATQDDMFGDCGFDSQGGGEGQSEDTLSRGTTMRRASVRFITNKHKFSTYIQNKFAVPPAQHLPIDLQPLEDDDHDQFQGQVSMQECRRIAVSAEVKRDLIDLPDSGCSPYYMHLAKDVSQFKSYSQCLSICGDLISHPIDVLHQWVMRLECIFFSKNLNKVQENKHKYSYKLYTSRLVKDTAL